MKDREELEMDALKEACSCRYYELLDTVEETPDEDLIAIIEHTIPCEICGK